MLQKKSPGPNPPKMAGMPDSYSAGGGRKKISILNLSLFAGFSASAGGGNSPTAAPRSPRSFDDGAVGLGIVAAIAGDDRAGLAIARAAAAMGRSEPIPIAGRQPAAWGAPGPKVGKAELSESYTCVISHVGGNPVKERVYFGEDVVFDAPPPPPPPAVEGVAVVPFSPMDFLSHCYLCKKKLDGLDIYMYRGDKAFCSPECRCQQMLMDEYRESWGSGALKSYECSVSPCSAPLLLATGIAAA